MKIRKTILCAFLFVLTVTILAFTVSADEGKIILSEDYRTLEYNGETYTYINLLQTSVWVNDSQHSNVDVEIIGDDGDVISCDVFFSGTVINIDLQFEENFLPLYYISDADLAAFYDFESNGSENVYTYTDYGEIISFSGQELRGEKTEMKPSEYVKYFAYSVYAVSDCGGLEKCIGEYVCVDGELYYLDYSELSLDVGSFFALDHTSLPVWLVTDEEVVDKLLGKTQDDNTVESEILITVTMVMFVLVLGVVPAVALVVGGILFSKARGEYRRLLLAIIAFAAVALVAFILMAICFVAIT